MKGELDSLCAELFLIMHSPEYKRLYVVFQCPQHGCSKTGDDTQTKRSLVVDVFDYSL